jgi:hypothetical protein
LAGAKARCAREARATLGARSLFIAVLLLATGVRAEDNYEQRFIDGVVKNTGRARAMETAGRKIEDIVVTTEEIFTKEDLWPTFLNVFHRVTRERIARQEVLLKAGDTWDQARAEETERNIRKLFVFALVKVVALEGDQGGVVMLVITRDRWSLRLNSEFNLVGSLLQYLRLFPTEQNFLGLNQQIALDFILRLDYFSVGEFFQDRRLFGTKLYFGETASIVFNRASFAPEGTAGNIVFGLPLTSLDQTAGFTVQGTWSVRRKRVFQGAHILGLAYEDDDGGVVLPAVWDVREGQVEANGALRFGKKWKLDLQGSAGFFTHKYTVPTEEGLSEAQSAWLTANWLPRSEYATYLYAEANLYPVNYQVLRNVDVFEISEDYNIAPLFKLAARWGLPAPLSSDHFLEVGATARYRAHVGGDFLELSAGGQVRFTASHPEPVNETVAVQLLNYSPPFWGGRFVTRFVAQWRWSDLDNRRTQLGGGNGLRGAAPEQFIGRHFLLSNIEYRTRSFELKTVFVGFVLFWDAGTAYDVTAQVTHTLGMGIRIFLPQFNDEQIRIDFGVVLGGPPPTADRIAASYGQITDLRPSQLSEPLPNRTPAL